MSTTRQVILDTETTGLDPSEGHRVIELGCVELINRRRSHNDFHSYCKPDREIDEGALEVHGITSEFLADKPRFAEFARDFLNYIKGAELVIHNAEFDIGFLDFELQRIGPELGQIRDYCTVLDTLRLARQTHPGQRNDLDALCQRYGIDNAQRIQHGALLDAEILADVYLAMTGGQTAMLLDEMAPIARSPVQQATGEQSAQPLKVIYANEEELKEHEKWLQLLDRESEEGCAWYKLEN